MTLFLGILLALFVFFVVVFLHEMGHFLVARWSGVKVLEFGIGIPPRLKKIFRDKKWTDWTLNWLPIGGFVRLKWEDISSPESREKDALPMAKWWKQVLILLAWVTMNFILAGLIFGTLFFLGTSPIHVQIREFEPNSLLSRLSQGTQLIPIFDTLVQAEEAGVLERKPWVLMSPVAEGIAEKWGIHDGDVLLSIEGENIQKPEDVVRILGTGKPQYRLSVLRDTSPVDIILTPLAGKIGVFVTPNIRLIEYRYNSLPEALYRGMLEVYHQIGFSFRTFGTMIVTSFSDTATQAEKKEATDGIGGPVAIGKVFVSLVGQGVEIRGILILIAMISLSLWVFNLIPFPALDGGRCFIVLVNQMIHTINPRYMISPRLEQLIHSIGFFLLILASILVTWKDIFTQ